MSAGIHRKLALCVAAAALCLAASASAARAEVFQFDSANLFAKAHDPVSQPPPLAISGQGLFIPLTNVNAWKANLAAAPEVTQAGGHPDFTAAVVFVNPPGDLPRPSEVVVDTPAGAVGNPFAAAPCELADFNLTLLGNCPTASQVGTAAVSSLAVAGLSMVSVMVPSPGQPALLAFKTVGISAFIVPGVRSEGDYGLRADTRDITPIGFRSATLTLWGVPGDSVHDSHRIDRDTGSFGGHVEGTPVPFLSAPTNCETGPLEIPFKASSWENPETSIETSVSASEPSGCDQLDFDPSLSAKPTTDVADQPTGLEVDVQTPQNNTCVDVNPGLGTDWECGYATSHLKDTTVTLPEGLSINPSGANGLDGCSPEEIGLSTPLGVSPQQFSAAQPACPDASKIATVEVDTPLLDKPMPGNVYIADPYDNPFRSLLAIYVVANDTERGVIVKLAGKVSADPKTGQLTTTFTDAPQLPFEHFKLHFKQGPHATLRTPPLCGDYSTEAQLSGYADPANPVPSSDAWSISKGPGGDCASKAAELPNSPSFEAGAVTPIAGAYTPFGVHLRRDDASQNFSKVEISPPPGLVAKLAGVPYCPEAALAAAAKREGKAEEADPSCPAASEVGSVEVAAGAGPDPYYTGGRAYLAGPYKQAPLSLAIITPATAGPFDLGTVVTRVALNVNPVTAQITAAADPIPEILEGIPLDVRSVSVYLDRPRFSRNPTSCAETQVTGKLTSTQGSDASLSDRFQLAECKRLGFRPKLYLRLYGRRFTRSANPRLRAVLVPRQGDANIARASVLMPNSIFLDQDHIRTVCTRAQFATETCPAGSIYGQARATTPLLDAPLQGNVYLRSSDNPLPDLVSDLSGQVSVEAIGRTDSVKGALRNTFDIVPDAPVSAFVMLLQGGQKSLLVASKNLCAKPQRARVNMLAHNGRKSLVYQPINIPRCRAARKAKRRRAQARKKSARRASLSAARRIG